MQFLIQTRVVTGPASNISPAEAYLSLRSRFPHSTLLESTDYGEEGGGITYICCEPIASVSLHAGKVTEQLPNGEIINYSAPPFGGTEVPAERVLNGFLQKFDHRTGAKERGAALPRGIINGLFGYTGYHAIPYAEEILFEDKAPENEKLPALYYTLYRYVIAIDHSQSTLTIIDNQPGEQKSDRSAEIIDLISTPPQERYPFKKIGALASNLTDEVHLALLDHCKAHIRRGDVFQIVLSRKFFQRFAGDDFEVYRALRTINPSPYLFYFDFGDFHLFGSSPEAQIEIRDRAATVVPIAGTYLRTGDEQRDAASAAELLEDPKESAEHAMLVDLARNDLSRSCFPVKLESYKSVQFYSHVIHLVSKVQGQIKPESSGVRVLLDTFPAGTLSGAPKYRAMQILNEIEPTSRTFYGGAVGVIGFEGDILHAIMIRTFLSKGEQLTLQAGSGVVLDSVPQNEVNEVTNKLAALHAALEQAEKDSI